MFSQILARLSTRDIQKKQTYKEWGVKVVLYPLIALYAAAKAICEVNELLKSPNLINQDTLESSIVDFDEFKEIMSLSLVFACEEI